MTANEGDARDYDGFGEEVRAGSLPLDPAAFPTAQRTALSRLKAIRAGAPTCCSATTRCWICSAPQTERAVVDVPRQHVPVAGGYQTQSVTFLLPAGPLQAVRGVYRTNGMPMPCSPGEMDDRDNLVFPVGTDVDTTPPSASFTAPANGATVKGTVTLSASASDNFGVARVDFYLGSTLLGSDTSAPYSFSWDTRSVPNGAQSLSVTAFDAAGLSATSSVSVTVDNDWTPPTVSLTAPASGATVSGTVTVSANASDNVGVAKVEFYDGSTLVGSDISAPFSFAWNSRNGPNGPRTVTARAVDAAGNSATSAPVTVTANNDFVPPPVSLTAPPKAPPSPATSPSPPPPPMTGP